MRRTRITRADIVPMTVYERERKERRARMAAAKKDRRVEIGPFATFYFENYETMLHQVHEMLFIEKGGEAQVGDELDAYNPLIPQGRELVATLMFEIEDPARRARELARLGGVESRIHLAVAGRRIDAEPVGDDERTTEAGKTSSVHFLRFRLGAGESASFKQPGAEIVIEIAHPNYAHMARMPDAVRQALAADLE